MFIKNVTTNDYLYLNFLGIILNPQKTFNINSKLKNLILFKDELIDSINNDFILLTRDEETLLSVEESIDWINKQYEIYTDAQISLNLSSLESLINANTTNITNISAYLDSNTLYPYISHISEYQMKTNTVTSVIVTGYYFVKNLTSIDITGSGSINVTEFVVVSPNTITFNIECDTEQNLNIAVKNGTYSSSNWGNSIQIKILNSLWVDLSSSGPLLENTTTHSGITINRTASYTWFSGVNPNQSWVKYIDYPFDKDKTFDIIFKVGGAFFIGFSENITNESASDQSTQGYFLAEFTNPLLSNYRLNSIITKNNACSVTYTLSNNNLILKLKVSFPDWYLYSIPSGEEENWDNEETLLVSGSCNEYDSISNKLVPFIIPRNTTNNSFYAFKIEQ